MTMECPDPVVVPPTLNILAAASVLPGVCDTAHHWEPLANAFTVPAVGSATVIAVCNSLQYAIGGFVYIPGAGFFEIIGRPNANAISVQNNGSDPNSAPGVIVALDTPIIHCGSPGVANPVFAYLDGSDTWDPGSIADGDEEAKEVTVTGAALGDFAVASFSLDVADLALSASVTAADTVTVVLSNNTGGAIDLASGTIRVRVFPL